MVGWRGHLHRKSFTEGWRIRQMYTQVEWKWWWCNDMITAHGPCFLYIWRAYASSWLGLAFFCTFTEPRKSINLTWSAFFGEYKKVEVKDLKAATSLSFFKGKQLFSLESSILFLNCMKKKYTSFRFSFASSFSA